MSGSWCFDACNEVNLGWGGWLTAIVILALIWFGAAYIWREKGGSGDGTED